MLGGCYLGAGRAKGVLLPEWTSVARTTEAFRSMSSTEKHMGLQATSHGVSFTAAQPVGKEDHNTTDQQQVQLEGSHSDISFSMSHTQMVLALIPCSNSSSFFMSLTISELVWPLLKAASPKATLTADLTVV